jgi:oligoendopeptidase F
MTIIPLAKTTLCAAVALACLAAQAAATPAPQPTTNATAAADAANPPAVWDLTGLYRDDDAWDKARQAFLAKMPALKALQGSLGNGSGALLKAMDDISAAQRELLRLQVYASLQADVDTRDTQAAQRRQLGDSAQDQFNQATSWLASDLSTLGATKVDADIAAEAGLKKHAYRLHTLLRLAGHTLSPPEEALLAAAGKPLDQPQEIYELLSNADLPWPTITVNGKKQRLDQETYVALRADRDPKVRAQVFKAFWPVYQAYQRTIGAIYVAHLDGQVFDSRARKFATSLDLAVSQDNTPTQVYRALVAETNAGLPTLQRFLKVRNRLLGLKSPQYSDVYAPMAKPPRSYTLADAEALTLEAVKPLGDDYVQRLRQHFQQGWMHALPQPGKRSGAYMNGDAFDVHPFVLLSFNDNYESVSTVAHEWGHAMHTVLADSAQPFETSAYGIFVAEIPSTANEMLLADYVTAHAKTREEKIYAIGQQLDLLRQTFFRQAMFAEFELKAHEAIERDQPLTGEDLSKLYLDLLRRYHGDAQGVMHIDALYGSEWEYIPHFYSDFYVYQYATSISAAAYFVEGIEKGDTALRDRYLAMLKAGGSDDPYLIVQAAGPDMATPGPYRALVHRMDRLIDELESLTK